MCHADIRTAGTHAQNTPANGPQFAFVIACRAGVKDGHIVVLFRLFETCDPCVFDNFSRVALGGHDDEEGAVIVPIHVGFRQITPRCCIEQSEQIRFRPQAERLAFGITETDVVFNQFRPLGGEYQSGVKHTAIGATFGLHRRKGGLNNAIQDSFAQGGSHEGRWRITAHAACIGAVVAIIQTFMILCAGQGQNLLAVAEDKKTDLFAVHKVFDHDLCTRRPKGRTIKGLFNRIQGRVLGHGDRNALPPGQTIGLDHNRRTLCTNPVPRFVQIVKAGIAGGGDTVFLAQVFHEAF